MGPLRISQPACLRPATATIILPIAYALFAASSGCQQSEDAAYAWRVRAAAYAELPGARASQHTGLRDELSRVSAEQGTPAGLARSIRAGELSPTNAQNSSPGEGLTPCSAEATAALLEVFPRSRQRSLRAQLNEVLPPGRFEFDLVRLARVRRVLEANRAGLTQYREWLKSGAVDRPIPFSVGLMENLSWLEAAAIGNQLESLDAANHLAADRPDEAVYSLQIMLRVAEWLAGAKSVASRVAGARLRLEALRVVEVTVQHPMASESLGRNVLQLVSDQLDRWPPDQWAWIGERAEGLFAYELIRDGHLMSLLEPEVVERWSASGELHIVTELLPRYVDEDERFYLQAMREMIAGCELPYSGRLSALKSIRERLELASRTTRRPLVADHLLLAQFESGHRWQAVDRLGCEAWKLALTASLDDETPAPVRCPVNGSNFQVRRDGSLVEVTGWDASQIPELPDRIVVPRRVLRTAAVEPREPVQPR